MFTNCCTTGIELERKNCDIINQRGGWGCTAHDMRVLKEKAALQLDAAVQVVRFTAMMEKAAATKDAEAKAAAAAAAAKAKAEAILLEELKRAAADKAKQDADKAKQEAVEALAAEKMATEEEDLEEAESNPIATMASTKLTVVDELDDEGEKFADSTSPDMKDMAANFREDSGIQQDSLLEKDESLLPVKITIKNEDPDDDVLP